MGTKSHSIRYKDYTTMKRFIILLTLIILVLVLIIFAAKKEHIIFNTTSSFPLGLYKISSKEHYNKGDLVSFCAMPSSTFTKMIEEGYTQPNPNCPDKTPQLLKKIVALAGDNITIEKSLLVNNKPIKNSTIFKKDHNGNLLYTQSSQTIKRGYFWAMSDYNEKSYDSRYFGQVPLSNIIGIATPILTWK